MATFPVQGYAGVVQPHWGSDHGAADLFAPRGTPVVAVDAGTVTDVGYSPLGGNNLTITHANGLVSYYAHLFAPPLVRTGQTVAAGTPLGGVGDTGNAKGTGAHLHFGYGYGIASGTGPHGGAGNGFDVTAFLTKLLGGNADPAPSPLPKGVDPPTTPPVTTTPGLVRTPGNRDEPGGGTPLVATGGTKPYSGSILAIQTGGAYGLPTGIGLDPGAVDAATGWLRRRLIPGIIGLMIAAAGAYLVGRGDAGARLLGLEMVVVGLSIVWFAYRDTTLVAWAAVKP